MYINTSPSNKKGYINNTYFFRAILKYGWNNFQHEILYSEKEAKQIEICLTAYYNSTDHNYEYNKTKGGD